MVLSWGLGSRCWAGLVLLGCGWVQSAYETHRADVTDAVSGQASGAWGGVAKDQTSGCFQRRGPVHPYTSSFCRPLCDACSVSTWWAKCLAGTIHSCHNLLTASPLLTRTLGPMSHRWSSTGPNLPCTVSPSPTSGGSWGDRGRRRGHLIPSPERVARLGVTNAGCEHQLGHPGDEVSRVFLLANLAWWFQHTGDTILGLAFWRVVEAKVHITYLWGQCVTDGSLSSEVWALCGSFSLCLWAKGAWRGWATCPDADFGDIGEIKDTQSLGPFVETPNMRPPKQWYDRMPSCKALRWSPMVGGGVYTAWWAELCAPKPR